MSETTYYSQGGIDITNSRAIIGGKTYAMANITSVSMGVISPNYILPAVVGIAGLLMLSISDFRLFGLLALVGAGVLFYMAKRRYTVNIGSASGESHALVDKDKGRIQEIVDAMNKAIVERG